jgi:hypothetical protein
MLVTQTSNKKLSHFNGFSSGFNQCASKFVPNDISAAKKKDAITARGTSGPNFKFNQPKARKQLRMACVKTIPNKKNINILNINSLLIALTGPFFSEYANEDAKSSIERINHPPICANQ